MHAFLWISHSIKISQEKGFTMIKNAVADGVHLHGSIEKHEKTRLHGLAVFAASTSKGIDTYTYAAAAELFRATFQSHAHSEFDEGTHKRRGKY